MLADPAARAATFGLDSPLVTRGWAAVKTGTSKDLRDNWCIGSTARYTVGVWVGNASGAPMHGVSGVSGAAPVWRELVSALHAREASRAPAPPAGWAALPLASALASARARAQAFGIQRPREGSIVVLDPDIPMAAQRLVIEGAPGRWRLDGRDLGSGARLTWLPRPGRHVLERRDADAHADAQADPHADAHADPHADPHATARATARAAPRAAPRADTRADTHTDAGASDRVVFEVRAAPPRP